MDTIQITGTAFLGADFVPETVDITISNGIIADISPARTKSGSLILPAFFNAHTHIGDTVALDTRIDRPLAELVAPPDGLKHRILRETPEDRLISAMRSSMQYMRASGTTGFADFREGGRDGVSALSAAKIPGIMPLIFGRDGGELLLLDVQLVYKRTFLPPDVGKSACKQYCHHSQNDCDTFKVASFLLITAITVLVFPIHVSHISSVLVISSHCGHKYKKICDFCYICAQVNLSTRTKTLLT